MMITMYQITMLYIRPRCPQVDVYAILQSAEVCTDQRNADGCGLSSFRPFQGRNERYNLKTGDKQKLSHEVDQRGVDR